MKSSINRRQFIKAGALTAVSAGVAAETRASDEKINKTDAKKILNYNPDMRYRKLGNTDIHLSVISLGGLVAVESVYHYAVDHGVNLFHTSVSYKDGQSVLELGKVMKEKRDRVYLAVKDTFDDIDEALKLLKTEYIDFLMFARHRASQADDERIFETFEKYKKQGKVRYAGLTTHKDVKATSRVGIASGRYTLIMPTLNQPDLELLDEELKLAQQKKMGIMAMKTMRGIKEKELQPAYLKKVLANPAVTTVLKGIGSFEMFDDYLKAAQEVLTSDEDFSLYKYAQKNRSGNCMMCSECERACPKSVEISTILRCKDYYYEQMGDLNTALRTYAGVAYSGTACDGCQLCERSCPNGIDIVARINEAWNTFGPMLA